MATEIKRTAETIRVSEVSKILVTEIVAEDGGSVRALRIWGSAGQSGLPILEIVLAATEAEALEIAYPEIRF